MGAALRRERERLIKLLVQERNSPLPGKASSLGVILGDGLPHSVQVIGPRYREDLCFDAAATLEDRVGIIAPIDPREP